MAIQIPNPGTGNGATGDNEFVLWTKVKDNFSNTTHAASRLVGTATGNVMEVGAFGLGRIVDGGWSDYSTLSQYMGINSAGLSGITGIQNQPPGFSTLGSGARTLHLSFSHPSYFSGFVAQQGQLAFYMQTSANPLTSDSFKVVYHTGNTTKDTATGFLKASSPVLHVYNDSITKIHEAEQLDITVDKKGVGHYEIHGTTGLRKNDGWFMSPPRDVHGNVLCMVDLEEKDGVVILKTYKKLFDFETVSIVHDYDNPMDIPDGVCVEFRFNDLPEVTDEPIE